jgi:hypothetical protein
MVAVKNFAAIYFLPFFPAVVALWPAYLGPSPAQITSGIGHFGVEHVKE